TRLAVGIGNKAVVAVGLLCYAGALVWTATSSQSTAYLTIAAGGTLLGLGMGLTQGPATEAIMGAVPVQKAGIGSAVNTAARLFGGTPGVAVVGSAAASLYTSRLVATLPAGLPAPVVGTAKGSVGGAVAAAAHITDPTLAHQVTDAALLAFLHSFA